MPTATVPYQRVYQPQGKECRMFGTIKARALDDKNYEIEFVVSNFRRDDYGTRFDPNGVDLSQYMRNPLVSFGHMRDGGIYRLPVGRGKKDSIHIDQEGNLRMIVQFTPPEVFDFGHQIYKLVKNEFLNMGSIAADVSEEELIKEADGRTTIVFRKWRLYDFSIVPLGANDDALVVSRCKQLGLDKRSLMEMEKDIVIRADEPTEEQVQAVAAGLSEGDVEVKKDEKPEEKKEEKVDEDISNTEEVQLETTVEQEGDRVKVQVLVRSKDGSILKRSYRSVEVAETKEQFKHRDYFEETKDVLKQYRSLMERLYKRIGMTPPSDEKVAVERITHLVKAPNSSPEEVRKQSRDITPAEISALVTELVPEMAKQVRGALGSGMPLKKLPDYIRELSKGVTSSISFPSSR